MPSSWMRELRSRDKAPASLPPLHFGEFPENTLEPRTRGINPSSRLRCGTRTSCPAPTPQRSVVGLARDPQEAPAKSLEPGDETSLWTAPTPVGQQRTLTMDGTQAQLRTDPTPWDHAGPEAAQGTRTFTGPDRTWGRGLKFIWDPDSDVGNLTRQIQDI